MFLLVFVLAASVASGASGEEACHDRFQCRNGAGCIPKWHLCDGDDDCQDQSDEHNATCAMSCTGPNAMWCEASGRCISSEYSCLALRRSRHTCEDVGFAEACAKYCTETPGLISCRNESKCVEEKWQCDGDRDCADGSDEDPAICSRLCAEKADHVWCNASDGSFGRKCILSRFLCDGESDCPEGEDESLATCEARCAEQGEFACGPAEEYMRCIAADLVCDGDVNCAGGEDEAGCGGDTEV